MESRWPGSGDSSSCRPCHCVPGVFHGPLLTLLSETILAAQGGTTIWKHTATPFGQEERIKGSSYLDSSPCVTEDIFRPLEVSWSFCRGEDSILPSRGFSSLAHISGVNNSFCLANNAPMGLFKLVQASLFFRGI